LLLLSVFDVVFIFSLGFIEKPLLYLTYKDDGLFYFESIFK